MHPPGAGKFTSLRVFCKKLVGAPLLLLMLPYVLAQPILRYRYPVGGLLVLLAADLAWGMTRQGRSVLRSVTGDLGFPRAEMSESIRDNPNRRLSHAGSLLEILRSIPDHRRAEGKRFDLATVVLYSILGMVAGANSYRQMHEFIRVHLQRLNGAFGLRLPYSPSYTGLRLIIQGVNPAALEAAFRQHASSISAPTPSDSLPAIAVDGKTLRGSFDAFSDRKAAHMMSALRQADQIVLGHLMVAEKSNEIPAAPELIEALGLKGCVFTLDAEHAQKNRSSA